jgi:predicted component of type VI protein secretion system
MVLGEVEETITIVDINEDTFEEVIRVSTPKNNIQYINSLTHLHAYLDCNQKI